MRSPRARRFHVMLMSVDLFHCYSSPPATRPHLHAVLSVFLQAVFLVAFAPFPAPDGAAGRRGALRPPGLLDIGYGTNHLAVAGLPGDRLPARLRLHLCRETGGAGRHRALRVSFFFKKSCITNHVALARRQLYPASSSGLWRHPQRGGVSRAQLPSRHPDAVCSALLGQPSSASLSAPPLTSSRWSRTPRRSSFPGLAAHLGFIDGPLSALSQRPQRLPSRKRHLRLHRCPATRRSRP